MTSIKKIQEEELRQKQEAEYKAAIAKTRTVSVTALLISIVSFGIAIGGAL